MRNIIILFGLSLLILSSILHSCKKKEVPTLTTSDITNITGKTATCGGTITDGDLVKIVERGICWSKENTPTIEDDRTLELGGSATFISNMTGLNEGTTYYVRAYAINSVGVGYGIELTFHTLGQVPSASTESATNITAISVTLNGTVNANCLSTDVTFEYFDNYGCAPATGILVHASPSPLSGSTTGNVSANITGLLPRTTYYYYVRAYNILGTSSGDMVSFTTELPYITFNPVLPYGSVTDVEGNVYKTIQIGTQTWMAENLKTTKYNDEEAIPLENSLAWNTLTAPAYCCYNMDITNKGIYGALYNWYTINTGKLCPGGWHVPAYDEWSTLLNYLGDTSSAYLKIREVGTMNWINSPNPSVTNASGFTALPGGMRSMNNVQYADNGYRAFWWTSTVNPDHPSILAMIATIKSNNTVVAGESFDFRNGFSVRCLKD